MKKYISREVKKLAIVVVLCLAVMLFGLIQTFAKDFDIDFILLTILFAYLSIFFGACYFAEKSRVVMIDEEKVLFPRGAYRNGRPVFRKTTVNLCDIQSVESTLRKGDGFFTVDFLEHTLQLKDGTTVSVLLYAYGKEAEQEIIETVRSNITQADIN